MQIYQQHVTIKLDLDWNWIKYKYNNLYTDVKSTPIISVINGVTLVG